LNNSLAGKDEFKNNVKTVGEKQKKWQTKTAGYVYGFFFLLELLTRSNYISTVTPVNVTSIALLDTEDEK